MLAFVAALLFTGCGGKGGSTGEPLAYKDYINTGKRIAVEVGDVYGDLAKTFFGAREVPEYSSFANILEELRRGRVDAAITNASYIRYMEENGQMVNFKYFLIPKDDFKVESGQIFNTTELRDQFNEWLAVIAADGTLDQMLNRWIGVPLPKPEDIPQFELTGVNGTLRISDTGNFPPLTYFDANNQPTGFNAELMRRFAQHLGKNVQFTMMDYGAITLHVASGKSDMSGCQLTITAERQEEMIFSNPVIVTQAALIVRR